MNSKLVFAVLIALFVMNQFMFTNDSNNQKNVTQNQQVEKENKSEYEARLKASMEKNAAKFEEWQKEQKQKNDEKRNKEIEENRKKAEESKRHLEEKYEPKIVKPNENIKSQQNTNQQTQQQNQPVKIPSIEYNEADINILISDAKNNAARANRAYNGKYVKIVGGYVHNIESDGDYISLSGDSSYSLLHVQCFPQNTEVREQIFNLNKGQYVTVYGRISKVGEIVGYRLEMHKIEY